MMVPFPDKEDSGRKLNHHFYIGHSKSEMPVRLSLESSGRELIIPLWNSEKSETFKSVSCQHVHNFK